MSIDTNATFANWHDAVTAAIRRYQGNAFSLAGDAAAGGGSISRSLVIRGVAGEQYFVKLNAPEQVGLFVAEQTGLAALRQAGCVRVPQVIGLGVAQDAAWLVLEYLPLQELDRTTAARLGEGLACLHRVTARLYGLADDNVIGATRQPNGWYNSWPEFWRTARLGFQLQLARQNGAPARLLLQGEKLLAGLDVFFQTYQPVPALLHGDLWAGNAAACLGEPVLYDPAVYFGDREADLAMTELFGGFPPAFYSAYQAAWPLDAGYKARRTLYNLYHILNHFNLFGGGYAIQAQTMAGSLLAEMG